MTNSEKIKLLKDIGKRLLCLEEEFKILLPNCPTIKGSEFVFTISWANSIKYIDNEVEFTVKGLHLLEILYRNKMQNEFGFGSPSPSYKIIKELSNKNNELAESLIDWIASNGGNYYIRKKER